MPQDRALRIIGDVHGDRRGLAAGCATDRFVIQLGDLVDDGPDSAGALSLMLDRQEAGDGIFLLGNHDYKLARALRGDRVVRGPGLVMTPIWIVARKFLFVHGGFHPAMLFAPAPAFPAKQPDPLMARALYGETTGRTTGAGRPERLLRWVEAIPPDITVYCGHDQRSTDGRPLTLTNRAGGRAVFTDTGAGKGGHLSWVDLPALDQR
ncbi:MAG: phosphatase [Acidiphilium sp. 34-60-192]|nr:MAG: phosphatase [Acidiphilium sp. 34-60-192]